MTALAQAMGTKRKARSSAPNASTIRPQPPLPKLSPVEEEALLGGHNRCLKCVWHPAGSKHTCDPEQRAVRLKGMRSDPWGVGAPPQAITRKGGHRQQPGVDFNETFAPVCSYRSVRMMLSVAAREGLHLRQFDIQNASFTVTSGKKATFGLLKDLAGGPGRVLRLNRALADVASLSMAVHFWPEASPRMPLCCG
jgi:hypothetical protein